MRVVAVLRMSEISSLQAGLGQTWGGVVQLFLFPTDVEAAEAILRDERPDVLVVDLDMPGVIGLDIVRSLREQPEMDTMPILLVSSGTMELDATHSGRTVLLTKPVAPESWKDGLKRALVIPASHEAPAVLSKKPPEEKPENAKTRKGERKAFEAACSVTAGAKRLKGTICDISISGARVVVDGPLVVGGMISFSFAIPRSVPLKFLYFKARVVRQAQVGYGIVFWEMDTITRTYLNAVVHKASG